MGVYKARKQHCTSRLAVPGSNLSDAKKILSQQAGIVDQACIANSCWPTSLDEKALDTSGVSHRVVASACQGPPEQWLPIGEM